MTAKKQKGEQLAKRTRSEVVRVNRLIERTDVAPIPENDPESAGHTALSMEIRRTVGWIRFCEDRIADLLLDGAPLAEDDLLDTDALSWGVVSRESIGATEFPGVNTREAAGVNVWEEKLRWNRDHLSKLTKQWINAGLDAKRLELRSRTLDVLESAIDAIVRDLGHNPGEASTRAIIATRLRAAAAAPDDDETELI